MPKTPTNTQQSWEEQLDKEFHAEFNGYPTLTGALRPKMIAFISQIEAEAVERERERIRKNR